MKLSHFIIAFGVTVAACAVSAANLRMAAGSRAHEVPETQSESCGSVMPQSMPKRAEGSAKVRRIPAGDLKDRNLKLMYKEDFSLFVEGSEEEPKILYLGWIGIPEDLTAQPGWTGNGIYEAGGALGLCNPGHDGYQGGGCINSPLGNYAGKIIVKFRIKALQEEGYVFTTLCKGGVDYPSQACDASEIQNLTEKNVWADLAYEIDDPYSDPDGFVQINAITFNGDGFIVDDIEIYRDMDAVTSPMKVSMKDFATDGFVATWGEIPAADDYLVTLVEETQRGTEPVNGFVDFNDVTAGGVFDSSETPESWDIHLIGHTQTSADKGVDGSPCIVLSDPDDYIQLPVTGGTFTRLSFFTRPMGENAMQDLGYLNIDVLDPGTGEWKRYAFMNVGTSNKETGYVVDVNAIEEEYPGMYSFKDLYTGVRLSLSRPSETCALAVDDIRFSTNPPRDRKTVIEDMAVEGTSYAFSGLDPDKEHYVSVKGRNSFGTSPASAFFHAFGIADVTDLKAVDMDRRGGVTAQWTPVPRATRYVVASYDVTTVSEDTPAAEILADDFSKVTVRNPVSDPLFLGNENSIISLDEYTQVPGWTGRGNIVAKGMLGCLGDPYGMFELYSPEITLSNNKGDYEVRLKVYSEAGAQFVVQGTGVYEAALFPETGLYEMTVPMTGGQDHDRLMFYTVEGEMFLIDDIKVCQNLAQGDHLYSLLDKTETAESSYRFSVDPEEGKLYGLQVQALQTIFNKTCSSGLSPMALVDFFGNSVDNFGADSTGFSIRSIDGGLTVRAGERDVRVFDVAGRAAGHVASGTDSTLELLLGIYIATDGVSSFKIIVKQ